MRPREHLPRVPVPVTAAILVAALAVSSGCGAMAFRRGDPGPLGEGAVSLRVPVIRQKEKTTCGLCVITMLARYYGVEMDEGDVGRVREAATSDAGASGTMLKETLERSGFRAFIFEGDLLDDATPRGISYHLRRRRPVIVMVSFKRNRRHYMVVTGLDPERGRVLLADPAGGSVSCGARAFGAMWEKGNRFALLAVPSRER